MQPKTTLSSLILHLLIGWSLISGAQNDTIGGGQESGGFCTSLDLDKSIMVECSKARGSCHQPRIDGLWPQDPMLVVLLISSRSGKRLAESVLKNLNYKETEQERLFNINTTLYLDTTKDGDRFDGFGTDLEPNKVNWPGLNHAIEGLFEPDTGIGFKHLMVPWNVGVTDWLSEKIEATLRREGRSEEQKTKLKLFYRAQSQALEESIALFSQSVDKLSSHTFLEYGGVSISGVKKNSVGILNQIKDHVGREIFLESDDLIHSKSIKDLSDIVKGSGFTGILYQSVHSRPYNLLQELKNESSSKLIVKSRITSRVIDIGEWQAAQDYAIEILNHLNYGANIILENNSMLEISDWQPDSLYHHSIYRLEYNSDIYHRAPRFYSMAHFSRFIEPGSIRLRSWVDTAPNMFAAHYIAYRVPDKGIVVVALNSNEHLNPFRIVVDSTITVHTYLEPKSFNTFLIPFVPGSADE